MQTWEGFVFCFAFFFLSLLSPPIPFSHLKKKKNCVNVKSQALGACFLPVAITQLPQISTIASKSQEKELTTITEMSFD